MRSCRRCAALRSRTRACRPMLDAVIDFLPNPTEVKADRRHAGRWRNPRHARRSDDNAPFSALAFKIATDPFVGTLTFFRVYSGVLNSGDRVYNPVKGRRERVGRMVQTAFQPSQRDQGGAGRRYRRGHRPQGCDHRRHALRPECPHHPGTHGISRNPSFPSRWSPSRCPDQEKMSIALGKLAQEDPSFRVETDEESGQTIISGMGELHLDIIVDRMKREFRVEANIGKPQVAYRETIRSRVEAEGRFVRQTGGRGQYGHVWLKIEPLQGRRRPLRIRRRNRRRCRAEGLRFRGRQGRPATDAERRAGRLSADRPARHPLRWVLSRGRLLRDGVSGCRDPWHCAKLH